MSLIPDGWSVSREETVTSRSCNCSRCPAFRLYCEGCSEPCRYSCCDGQCSCCAVRCARRHDLEGWLTAIDGLGLDMPLRPQPQVCLPAGYFPQLLNGLEVPSANLPISAVAVGIAKILTPGGWVSRRALPWRFSSHNLRAQWQLGPDLNLVCIGNDQDHRLERLWVAQPQDVWMQVRVLGFDFATSLNFSIYLDQPRMEHLINIKRTWLTVQQMQKTSSLIAIPHLQWATIPDLQRQLHYAQAQGFHTLTMNLQMIRRQGWDTVAMGIPLIRESSPGLRFLFSGVVSLKRMEQLALAFPGSSFTNTTAHYLAQRYVRLQRDGTRLIKEPAEGHPDLILVDNVRLFCDLLCTTEDGKETARPQPEPQPPDQNLETTLQTRFGFDPWFAHAAVGLLSVDETILVKFQNWLNTGEVDRDFRGSFPTWPCSECVSHPTLGELLNEGADHLDAFLHLAYLAHQVDEEIQAVVGQAGY